MKIKKLLLGLARMYSTVYPIAAGVSLWIMVVYIYVTPEKAAIIWINKFGEATIELVATTMGLMLLPLSWNKMIRQDRRDRNANN